MRWIRRLVRLLVTALMGVSVLGACLSSAVVPATPGSFRVSPVEFEETVSSGHDALFHVFIANNSDEAEEFVISVAGCNIDRQGNRDFPDRQDAGEYSSATWVQLLDLPLDSRVSVAPNEVMKLAVKVSVPPGVLPGDYYSVVFIEPVTYLDAQMGSLQVQLKSRVGSVLKINVPGPVSFLNMRSLVTDLRVTLPDEAAVKTLHDTVNGVDEAGEVTDDLSLKVVGQLKEMGYTFDYGRYSGLPSEERAGYTRQIEALLAERLTEMRSISVHATLKTEARKMIMARGEASIYQETVGTDGKRRRQLTDRFVLTPAGSGARGEDRIPPGGMRDFSGVVGRPLAAGDYTAEVSFEFWPEDEGDENPRRVTGQTSFRVSENMAIDQKDMLILSVDPELLEYDMVAGQYHVDAVRLENLDTVERVEVCVISTADWLEVSPDRCLILPGRTTSIRVAARIPKDAEVVDREAKVVVVPDHGKAVAVDVKVRSRRAQGGPQAE